jgi:signal transduction histidine kinase
MSYGARIIFYFVVISVIWFFALNIISITYYKNTLEEMTAEQAALHLRLAQSGHAASMPGHLVASDRPLDDKSLILLPGASAGVNLYVRRAYMEERLKNFALVLFGVEASLFLSLMFFTYVVVRKFVRDIDSGEKFLNLILLSFNHKIGNFLAAQKLNVEILRERAVSVSEGGAAAVSQDAAGGDIRIIERLCANCQNMEADVGRTLRMVRAHAARVKFREKTDLMEAMKNTLELFNEEFFSQKRLTTHLESIIVKADPNDVENVFYNLVSNAVKYSDGSVHVRMSKFRGIPRVFIRNDLTEEPTSGAGLGIEITNSIAEKNGWKVEVRKKTGYIVYIKFK